MKQTDKNTDNPTLDKIQMRQHILHSMIASFKIEGIEITEKRANEILEKVNTRLK